jgi:hypothetical protein
MRTLVRKLALFAVLGSAICSVAQTASAPSKLASAYSLTGTGFGSAERITNPGTIYVIHIDGLLARAIANHVTPTNTIVDGKLLPPAKGFRAAFGASGDVKQVQPDQRFYVHALEVKDDGIVFTFSRLTPSTSWPTADPGTRGFAFTSSSSSPGSRSRRLPRSRSTH